MFTVDQRHLVFVGDLALDISTRADLEMLVSLAEQWIAARLAVVTKAQDEQGAAK